MENLGLIFNALAVILSSIASVYFFVMYGKFSSELKTGFLYLGGGVLVAITIHSFSEILEAINLLDSDLLFILMPILVSIGSLSLIVGARKILAAIKNVNSLNA